jgi:hypothetical protein
MKTIISAVVFAITLLPALAHAVDAAKCAEIYSTPELAQDKQDCLKNVDEHPAVVPQFTRPAVQAGPGKKITPNMLPGLKAAVAYHMKDPNSAQFRNLYVARNAVNGSELLCGEVNVKNGFGGYVGFTPFAAYEDGRKKGEFHADVYASPEKSGMSEEIDRMAEKLALMPIQFQCETPVRKIS